jgi:hypothetical protein
MNWTIPLSANLVIRNLGLTLFLAQVGLGARLAELANDPARSGPQPAGYWFRQWGDSNPRFSLW